MNGKVYQFPLCLEKLRALEDYFHSETLKLGLDFQSLSLLILHQTESDINSILRVLEEILGSLHMLSQALSGKKEL